MKLATIINQKSRVTLNATRQNLKGKDAFNCLAKRCINGGHCGNCKELKYVPA